MSFLHKKNSNNPKDYLAALDVGGSKISCLIARLGVKEAETLPEIQLLGVGQQVSRGLKNGTIINMEALEDAILNAVHSAEQQAGITLENVVVGLPIQSLTTHIVTQEIDIHDEVIDTSHIRRLMNFGQFPDYRLLHALPMDYQVDDTKGIKDPRGLYGKSLGIRLHLILASQTLIRNLSRCIGQCHLDVSNFVAASYASSLATLVEDELHLGVTLIDMGGAGTTLASFVDGQLGCLGYVPLGGMHVTNDIARGLSTPVAQAERLKTLYGSVSPAVLDDREPILIPLLGEDNTTHINQAPKAMLTHIIRCRMEEIFTYLVRLLHEKKLEHVLNQRVVLTGGASQLAGVREFATLYLGDLVRMGIPQRIKGDQDIVTNPGFSTGIGLLHYIVQGADRNLTTDLIIPTGNPFARMYQWLRDNL